MCPVAVPLLPRRVPPACPVARPRASLPRRLARARAPGPVPRTPRPGGPVRPRRLKPPRSCPLAGPTRPLVGPARLPAAPRHAPAAALAPRALPRQPLCVPPGAASRAPGVRNAFPRARP
jgi:hypothetical protein